MASTGVNVRAILVRQRAATAIGPGTLRAVLTQTPTGIPMGSSCLWRLLRLHTPAGDSRKGQARRIPARIRTEIKAHIRGQGQVRREERASER